jgi:phenylpropionate dioxygenase-like ring-hydroxylating dioxygenase large terminal subunit
MYINFWYPICSGRELTASVPVRSRVLGLPFVAFRDASGRACVLSDVCAHRGGSLGKGKVVDGCIACPYHGWRYDREGRCQLVPSLGAGARIPPRAKVDSYPVVERYGIVFAFLGDLPDSERPPLYEIEEFDDAGWRASDIMILDINCYYERSIENGVDPIHNEFVHPVQGSPQPIPGTVEYPETAWGSGVASKMTEIGRKTSADEERGMASDPDVLNAASWHHGPNTLITWITFGENRALHQYMFEAPIDGEHTKVYFINLRSFYLEPKYDDYVRKANLRVTAEDIGILEDLCPVRTPRTRTKETLVPGDKPIARYRDFLADWEARGWRIDQNALRQTQGDVAYAIPCPARRGSGNWVIDPVPLMR